MELQSEKESLMETHNHVSDVYDKFLKIFTIVAGWVVGVTALYLLFSLFSQFITGSA